MCMSRPGPVNFEFRHHDEAKAEVSGPRPRNTLAHNAPITPQLLLLKVGFLYKLT